MTNQKNNALQYRRVKLTLPKLNRAKLSYALPRLVKQSAYCRLKIALPQFSWPQFSLVRKIRKKLAAKEAKQQNLPALKPPLFAPVWQHHWHATQQHLAKIQRQTYTYAHEMIHAPIHKILERHVTRIMKPHLNPISQLHNKLQQQLQQHTSIAQIHQHTKNWQQKLTPLAALMPMPTMQQHPVPHLPVPWKEQHQQAQHHISLRNNFMNNFAHDVVNGQSHQHEHRHVLLRNSFVNDFMNRQSHQHVQILKFLKQGLYPSLMTKIHNMLPSNSDAAPTASPMSSASLPPLWFEEALENWQRDFMAKMDAQLKEHAQAWHNHQQQDEFLTSAMAQAQQQLMPPEWF